ncbi:DUF7426 family protein [Streptomyces jumonjinensis]|uniref:DUF7426 domain-containing protein n=1 Tax=Streptomyces jumonjinensis TaxID=1945 RepID=A0A646KP67_STRJU|nr:hypothetical protein [Streptomyces jumonjinensis]MQT03857.1 hypothetical protein [Streptomyces jumonjinensis]
MAGAGGFKPLEAFLDDGLTLPVTYLDGSEHEVRIPAPPADDGLKVQTLMDAGVKMARGGAEPDTEVLDDLGEMDLYRTALGTAYQELRANTSWPWFKHVAMTAVIWITADIEAAERYWAAGGDPEAMSPAPANRAERRASSRAAKSTKKQGSRSGTKPRKGTGPAREADQT